jgi:hypothetical protein
MNIIDAFPKLPDGLTIEDVNDHAAEADRAIDSLEGEAVVRIASGGGLTVERVDAIAIVLNVLLRQAYALGRRDEAALDDVHGMDFGRAVAAMQRGRSVRRKSWAAGITIFQDGGDLPTWAKMCDERFADLVIGSWRASHEDVRATDWEMVS